MSSPHDPGANPEDEGIPDLQDGTPEQQRASDPQQVPVPGDEPTVALERGTTVDEVIEGEPLDVRLDEEEPEPDPAELREPGAGSAGAGAGGGAPGEPPQSADVRPEAGEGVEAAAGRLEDGVHAGWRREQDYFAAESPGIGLSAEEEAVRIRDDEELDDEGPDTQDAQDTKQLDDEEV